MSLRSYPKVLNLGHNGLTDLLEGDVVVQEKIDGSQFSFGLVENIDPLKIRSRSQEIDPAAPPKMFAKAVETVKAIASLLKPGWTYRGEVLDTPCHVTLAYERVPKGNVILYDVDTGIEAYMTPEELEKEAARLGLEVVPTFYTGPGSNVTKERLDSMLAADSVLGKAKIEGMVIKNYSRYGKDGKMLVGKYVSAAFREMHKEGWKANNSNGAEIKERLGKGLAVPARWEKAIQHLQEQGKLEHAFKDIGPLLKELNLDIETECKGELMEALWLWARKDVLREAVKGFVPYYKAKLADRQFEGATNGPNAQQS